VFKDRLEVVQKRDPGGPGSTEREHGYVTAAPSATGSVVRLDHFSPSRRLRASDIMEPNLTYVYPHTRIQSLVSILRTTVHHAFPVVTENRGNEREFMKGNQLISNNIKFKVKKVILEEGWTMDKWFPDTHTDPMLVVPCIQGGPGWLLRKSAFLSSYATVSKDWTGSKDFVRPSGCVCILTPASLWISGGFNQPTRLLSPWDFPGKNTGVGSRSLLQGIFLMEGSNPSLPQCSQILYHMSHQGSLVLISSG